MRPDSYGRKRLLRFAGLFMLCVALITTLFVSASMQVNATANKTISFQGRLLDSFGGVVPDGSYNIQFKIYEGGSGAVEGNPDGELKWTESYINGGSSGGVNVKNGSLSVNLGSETPFGDSVNWNHDTIWLSINVAGSSSDCEEFGASPCLADGEMLPMKRMTATPYSMNAGAVGGKSADELVQLGQGPQADASDNSSIFINKVGSGNLVQLQNSATDIFTITNYGDLLFGGGDITIGGSEPDSITIGSDSETANQDIIIGTGSSTAGGSTIIQAKDSVEIATNGETRMTFTDDNSAIFGNGTESDSPSDFSIQGTNSSADEVDGGSLVIQGGDAAVGNSNGGSITIGGGAGSGDGASGLVIIKTPTFQTAEQQVCDEDCVVLQSNIDDNGALSLSAEAEDLTFTMNDPTRKTAGRVVYVSAASDSQQFTLSINGGGAGDQLTMKPGATTTLFWNGSDWTTTNGANQVTEDEDLLGSMYYDTTIGKLQCYEVDGWGDCGVSPDTFVTLSPEYTNSVSNGTGVGELTSDICSDTLGINDGSNSQPEICGENETYNFYSWGSEELTAQTRSIYVTHQLPASFKEFAPGSMSLTAKTDSLDADVSYQIYRNSGTGLEACGLATPVSTGDQTTWQKVSATGTSDPADCNFSPGDSIIIKIDLTAASGANAYISNLNFVFSNN